MNIFIRLSIKLLVVSLVISTCVGFRTVENSGARNKENDFKFFNDQWPALKYPEPTRSGFGLSAWGIVIVVVSIIIGIMGMYFFSICFPVLCKRDKKFDKVKLTSTV